MDQVYQVGKAQGSDWKTNLVGPSRKGWESYHLPNPGLSKDICVPLLIGSGSFSVTMDTRQLW